MLFHETNPCCISFFPLATGVVSSNHYKQRMHLKLAKIITFSLAAIILLFGCSMFRKGDGVEIRPFYLISRVDNLVQFLGQFVDLKFRPERHVIADLFFLLFWFLS